MMRVFRQFLTFSGFGVIGTLGHYVTLIGAVEIVRANAVLASSAGFVVGALVNYWLNYHFTFRSSSPHRETLPRFLLVASAGMIVNALVMSAALRIADIHYLVAQVVATGLVLVWNFAANRSWTFGEKRHGR